MIFYNSRMQFFFARDFMGGRLLLFSSLVVFCLQSAKAQTYDYQHELFDCSWLEQEYDRLIHVNENPREEAGLGLTGVIAAPFIVLEKLLGIEYEPPIASSIGGSVSFSGSVHDIGKAARAKNCYELYDRYFQANKSGQLDSIKPAPAKSVLPE